MKPLLKLAVLASGCLLASLSEAAVGQFENQKTTCYVFKSNKLVKKATCTYEGSSGGAASGYAVFEANFNVKGYGVIAIVDNWSAEDDENGKWKNEQVTRTIDGKHAIYRNRNATTFNVLKKNASSENQLTCYANKNTSHELCYVDNTPR